ncbi:MAG: hypothetical protein ACYTFK_10540 [Planctomycetota bacterium]
MLRIWATGPKAAALLHEMAAKTAIRLLGKSWISCEARCELCEQNG